MVDIKFTKEQFEALLKMAYLGNWVINAHRIDDIIEEFNEMEEYLFSKTALFGLEKYSDSQNPSFPSSNFEASAVQEYLDEYDNETFWDELAERMAVRQILSLFPIEELEKMDPMDRVLLISRFEDELKEEFSENNIDNLIFKS